MYHEEMCGGGQEELTVKVILSKVLRDHENSKEDMKQNT